MYLGNLTRFASALNVALDTGNYNDISISEVEEHIDKEDLIQWLRKRMGEELDLSGYDSTVSRELNLALNDILTGYKGEEGRKWGIYNNGLHLLIAWTLNLIALREWDSKI